MEPRPALQHGVWLQEERALDSQALTALGGKAGTLLRLSQAGFPVLPGLVLLPAAYRLSRGLASQAPPGAAADQAGCGPPQRLDDAVRQELLAALPGLLAQTLSLSASPSGPGPEGVGDWERDRRKGHGHGIGLEGGGVTAAGLRQGCWAVRSSARAEDGARRSYAGQFATVLEVPTAELAEAILTVWRSALAPALATYRRASGEQAVMEASICDVPAVLIQPMLAPSVAGVAFAADPLSGRRSVTLVQAVAGVAAELVAGSREGESWSVDRRGAILDHRRAADAGAGDAPLLADPDLRRIVALSRRLSQQLGAPQDVEWALLPDGQLWLLQSRPIGSLRGLDDPDGRLALWDNSNIVESYSGVTTPLTFSFARKAYTEVYAQFCRFMGVREDTIRRHRSVFGSMIGYLEGRIYYNLLNWYRVLALLPGYRLNSRFLEQMLGVKHGLPEAEMERVRQQQRDQAAADLSPRWLEVWRLALTAVGLVVNALTLGQRSRQFRRRLDRVLLSPAEADALAEARPDELVQQYRRIEAELLSHWDAPLINDFYAMIVYGLLRLLLQRWCGAQEAECLNEWIAGDGSVISAEPPRRIRAMAELLLLRPDLVAVLRGGSPAAIQRAVASLPPLQAELDRYLDDFGDRCLEELKLETQTLRDDPLPLMRTLAAMADRLRLEGPPGAPVGTPSSPLSTPSTSSSGLSSPISRTSAPMAGTVVPAGDMAVEAAETSAAASNPSGSDRRTSTVASKTSTIASKMSTAASNTSPTASKTSSSASKPFTRAGRSRPVPDPSTTSPLLSRHPDPARPRALTTGPRLPRQPMRAALLRWLRQRAQALVSNRENLRFERTRVFGQARRILLELGRRLAVLGLLEQAEDVMFLEVEEVMGVVEANASGADLGELVALRRRTWERQRLLPALPRRFETRGLPCLATADLLQVPPSGSPAGDSPGAGEAVAAADPVQHWQGLGCAAGVVRGQVALVSDPRQWLEIGWGQERRPRILVAHSTDPGWVLLFPHAAGLLVERGSVLSHVAIVARELGLPMISDLSGIRHSLREGEWLEMDGRSGRVKRLAPPAEPLEA